MPNYKKGAELPDLAITWLDDDGDLVDFSFGWSFVAKVGFAGRPAKFTKAAGFTGAAAAPNLVISWDVAGELNALDANQNYEVDITATRAADNKTRTMATSIFIEDVVT